MTKTNIINKIEELENKRFLLAMADHWTQEDFDLNDKWFKEIMELKAMLNIKKVYDVQFVRPNKKNLEERVIYLATFDTVEEAKTYGRAYEKEYNDKVIGRTNKGYYDIKDRETEE